MRLIVVHSKIESALDAFAAGQPVNQIWPEAGETLVVENDVELGLNNCNRVASKTFGAQSQFLAAALSSFASAFS